MTGTPVDEDKTAGHNRFELVLLAAQRGREIAGGAPPTIERCGHKNAVLALREISEKTVSIHALQESLIQNFQKNLMGDEPEEDAIGDQFVELMVEEQLYAGEAILPIEIDGFSIEEAEEEGIDLLEEDDEDIGTFEDFAEDETTGE